MYEEKHLSLEEARRAVRAILDTTGPEDNPAAIAVVDARGELICGARQDGAASRMLQRAWAKAYTAAIMRMESARFGAELVYAEGRTLDIWGDPMLTTLQGGVPIVAEGRVIGALACSGNSRPRDEAFARAGLAALDLPT